MKNNQTFWALLALSLGAILVAAWNPSAASFNTNQFSNPNYNINIKTGAAITNAQLDGVAIGIDTGLTNAYGQSIQTSFGNTTNEVTRALIAATNNDFALQVWTNSPTAGVTPVSATNPVVAVRSLNVGTNGWTVSADGNQNYSGLWDRFVGGGSTLNGVTNSATETMIYSNVVPGHAIGTNGVLKVTVLGQTGWTTPNNATVNIRYGGLGGTIVASFTYGTATTSTLRSEYQMRAIYNQASESSQVSMTPTTATYTDSGGVVTTASFDTSTNFPLTITLKANGSVGTNTILAAEIEIKHKN